MTNTGGKMDKSSIKAVVFDMDGVLLDTETISWETWDIAGAQFHLDPSTIPNAKRKCMGANNNDTQRILKSIYGDDFKSKEFLDRARELFYDIESSRGIPLMKGVLQALDYLKSRYVLALATSTREVQAHRQLISAGLIDYFSKTIYGNEVLHSKPDPFIYTAICKKVGIPPQNCVAIEDSPNGIKSAHASGMACIMVPDKVPPDDELRSLADAIIPSLLKIPTIL